MASGLSSSITVANTGNYDVFLSFRGEDTRHSFTDHLYDALRRAGINTFRDGEEIKRGEELKPEIARAIKESKASIVVLSQNYATSTWCLDELLLILEQRRKCNHFVLPVFYHVDPFFVRKQINTFAIKVKASLKWTNHNVNLWKKALTEVADLAGMVLSGSETMFLKEIVDTIYNKLDRKEIHLPSNLTGMATRYEEINSWLNTPNVEKKRYNGSETMEGLTLNLQILRDEKIAFESSNLKTDALKKMDNLKLLQLNFAQLTGSYEKFSQHLRWLCWVGFHLKTIPSELYMGNLVAIDMSYSNLEVFEPPTVLQSLQILNLKDSQNLTEIRNMYNVPHLETLILWNCHSLVRVCETIRGLTSLSLLNMTGCKNVFNREQKNLLVRLLASTFYTRPPIFSFPNSLQRLFLKDCKLECTDSFPLTFSSQPSLEYLNLVNSLFEFLPCYDHLKNLRVLDLSLCTRLKQLLCLPNTLAELYVYYCNSLEKISFQSHRFTLQEFGHAGCISLSEIEGFIKLVPVAKLGQNDLQHMKWLKEYENLAVCLVGDDELTKGRSSCLEMLYEFDIMSTSVPDIKDPNMKPKYVSESSSLSFEVPSCPKNMRLKGLDVTFKYKVSSGDDDDDWAMTWFCKISTTNGVDLMYNPKVFGKPDSGKVGIWLSYWPIGDTLNTGDEVNVSVVVMTGLDVHECGVNLVYIDDDKEATESLENNIHLSGFQLSTGAYYLCRRDFFALMEVGRLTPDWFRILLGDAVDYTEVRGWRKTGRPKQLNPSFTELKTVRCIIYGPQSEEIYEIAEMSKSTFVDKISKFTSSMLGVSDSATSSKFADDARKELYESMETFAPQIQESSSSTHREKQKSLLVARWK